MEAFNVNLCVISEQEERGGRMLAGEINRWKWGTAEMRDKKGSEEIERGMVQDGRDTLVRRETCGKIV